MKWPPSVERDLVRALSGYMQAAPVSELPPSIRRFRKFRAASLWPRRDRLLQAVEEDEELRAAILEWLEDAAPRLGHAGERLRLFAGRPEGWEQQLASPRAAESSEAAAPATPERKAATPDYPDYKAEARRLRSEMREMAREYASASAVLGRRIEELESRAGAAEAAAKAAAATVLKSSQEHSRQLRRLQRAAERAVAERDTARSEVKVLRRELGREKRRADTAEELLAAAAAPADAVEAENGTAPSSTPRRRGPLPVPPGLLEDDPATLARWLEAPGVRLLVDGYNVAMQDGAFKALSTEDQRARTVEEVTRLVRRHGVEATVVFDGAEVAPGVSRRRRGPVNVEYSRPPEIADDHVVKLLESWPATPVVVATSDKELQDRCRALGSTIATSEQLLAAVR